MFERDYILRLIEQLTQVLSKILFSKGAKNLDEAKELIRQAYPNMLGLDPDLIRSMSDVEIINFLKITGSTQYERCLMIAELLKEEAAIDEMIHGEGNEESVLVYFDSLSLFLEALINKDELMTDRFVKDTESVLERVSGFQIPPEIAEKLIRYYEIQGRFADAEDVLFELTETGEPGYLQKAEKFYLRLMEKPEEELRKGNLPKEEVLEGLNRVTILLKKDHL
ncbi:MAG: DUF6483 family protein [Bacteroidota bacterium]|jgi:hypothetical protein|nr:hypothetical protein [Ignavibacteria bacterium]MCU7498798.1 hypothetical protein [Ignavibacteria bacterium]MCU7512165.1 hypothetical protein [Ignavibacteria bacterium]MCU7520514.1 hypothetical protein [Ignavibacteria bacterium]MCU7523990.1 hypothetical protein [Ignavibacteria bacterium]